MTILDRAEAWMNSVRGVLEPTGVVIHFDRTRDQRPKQSCALNMRQPLVEVDLLVWESGEAELNIQQSGGNLTQEHFDDIRDPEALSVVLARAITCIRLGNR